MSDLPIDQAPVIFPPASPPPAPEGWDVDGLRVRCELGGSAVLTWHAVLADGRTVTVTSTGTWTADAPAPAPTPADSQVVEVVLDPGGALL